jgi:hypothetical protein
VNDSGRHRDYLELAAAAIDFELSAEERAALEAHLAGCTACRRRVEGLRWDARRLTDFPVLAVAPAASARLWRGIQRPRWPMPTMRLVAVAALLGLALLAALAVGASLLRPPEPSDLAVVPNASLSASPVASTAAFDASGPPPSFAASAQPAIASPEPPIDGSPATTTVPPGPSAVRPDPSTAVPEPSNVTTQPSPTPAQSQSATPSPTPAPAPTPTPAPKPTVGLLVDGNDMSAFMLPIETGDSRRVELELVTQHLALSACTLTHSVEPDKPGVSASKVELPSVATQSVDLIDGGHTFQASCKAPGGPLVAKIAVRAADRQPEACLGFEFSQRPISVTTLAELNAGVLGTWEGCATTPWTPPYVVAVTFRDDGTYSASSSDVLDGQEMQATYYGTDDEVPGKQYAINDLQDSLKGLGQIDLVFNSGSVTRDELRNIELMGDQLRFEIFHFVTYGPITFELFRAS